MLNLPAWGWVAAICAALPLAGFLYQRRGLARDRLRFPAPGRIVNGIHLHRRGDSGPWVILEAGIAASSASWRPVADLLAADHRVLAYDRPGFGWSPVRPQPRVIPQLVEELREALDAAGIDAPACFVGHSFGGLLARHFAARYPERVASLVLADPLLPTEWHPASGAHLHKLGRGVRFSRRGATLARFGVVRFALDLLLSGSTSIPKLLARASSSSRAEALTNRLAGEIRKLPDDLWPVIASHWCNPRSFLTMAEYLERLPENCAVTVDDSCLSGKPLAVISAETAEPAVRAGHAALARASSLGRHVLADGSGHWVQLDRPDLIAAAVRMFTMEGRSPKEA